MSKFRAMSLLRSSRRVCCSHASRDEPALWDAACIKRRSGEIEAWAPAQRSGVVRECDSQRRWQFSDSDVVSEWPPSQLCLHPLTLVEFSESSHGRATDITLAGGQPWKERADRDEASQSRSERKLSEVLRTHQEWRFRGTVLSFGSNQAGWPVGWLRPLQFRKQGSRNRWSALPRVRPVCVAGAQIYRSDGLQWLHERDVVEFSVEGDFAVDVTTLPLRNPEPDSRAARVISRGLRGYVSSFDPHRQRGYLGRSSQPSFRIMFRCRDCVFEEHSPPKVLVNQPCEFDLAVKRGSSDEWAALDAWIRPHHSHDREHGAPFWDRNLVAVNVRFLREHLAESVVRRPLPADTALCSAVASYDPRRTPALLGFRGSQHLCQTALSLCAASTLDGSVLPPFLRGRVEIEPSKVVSADGIPLLQHNSLVRLLYSRRKRAILSISRGNDGGPLGSLSDQRGRFYRSRGCAIDARNLGCVLCALKRPSVRNLIGFVRSLGDTEGSIEIISDVRRIWDKARRTDRFSPVRFAMDEVDPSVREGIRQGSLVCFDVSASPQAGTGLGCAHCATLIRPALSDRHFRPFHFDDYISQVSRKGGDSFSLG